MSKKKYSSRGKLLLFGEYAVIDGAKSLAIPTKQGQTLQIKPHRGSDLIWECYDENDELWFESQISLYDFSPIRTSDPATSKFVQKLLKGAVQYNSEFLNKWNGFKAIHRLEFPRQWGLGSSSTVINNVAQWAEINPFHLFFRIGSGSGYDVACASADGPMTYQLSDDELHFAEIDFEPSFLDNIYFVYLGNKQSTAAAISHYSKHVSKRKELAAQITNLTDRAIESTSIGDFMDIVEEHEAIISKAISVKTIQSSRFADYDLGVIKSLGAWGGDFAMVVSSKSLEENAEYFKNKGCTTIISYADMLYTSTIEDTVATK